jgi:hypothetical protein
MIIRSFSRQYRLKSNRKKRRAKRALACNPILSFALVDTIHGFLVSVFFLLKGNRIVPKTIAQRVNAKVSVRNCEEEQAPIEAARNYKSDQ